MSFFIKVWICIFVGLYAYRLLTSEIAWQRHIAYGRYVYRHKKFVFQECLKLNIPLWIALLHDWDKLLPFNWVSYARTFYKEDGGKQYDNNDDFATAWLFHQNINKHHWQFWMLTWDKGNTECRRMPDLYIREMIADWRGAGRAITGADNTDEWYMSNRDNIKLHPDTRIIVETMLGIVTE